jgi:UDP-N-acetylmuramate--alanine ligase
MRYHFIGIGGAGLSAIARVLVERGAMVSGSDQADSPFLDSLRDLGVQVTLGHRSENLKGADLVVISSAVRESNVELAAARAAGLPVYKRVDFLAPLTEGKRTVAVAGTHGKTTTTGEIAHLLFQGGLDPTFIAGGSLEDFAGANARAGQGEHFVIEADEYDQAFWGLSPWVAVVTNVEHDHPDCYPTLEDMYRAFQVFLGKIQAGGTLIVCADSPGAVHVAAEFSRVRPDIPVQTYAVDMDADWQATQIQPNNQGGSDFQVIRRGEALGRVRTRLPGMHNVCNTLAALAAAEFCGLPFSQAAKGLAHYHGVERRFEIRGEAGGITVVDDYAHHPSEIRATLAAARQRFPGGRIWAVWQPHTYSRTRALAGGFECAFGDAHQVVVLPVYQAREPVEEQFPIEDVVRAMTNTHARYIPGFAEAVQLLGQELQPGDVVITLSAGDANRVGVEVLNHMRIAESAKDPMAGMRRLPLDKLVARFGESLQMDVQLARLSTAKVGGPADALLEVHDREELAQAVEWLWQEGLPFFLLGSGSNVLFADAGCRDLVILNRARKFEIRPDKGSETGVVWAESGVSIGAIARQCAQLGWTGMEWAATVPGTVGGAVYGNAGAFGSDTAGSLQMVEILQRMKSEKTAGIRAVRSVLLAEDLEFSYRSSRLKRDPGRMVVLSVGFALRRCDPSEAVARIGDFLSRRRKAQPAGPSLGSMFKNPPGDFAGRLIEAAGLKGRREGNVEISVLHANFFLNHGDARAEEIRALMELARRTVREQFGVELEPEIQMAGDWTEPK